MARNGHVLYRIYDNAGTLLYVGATTNPALRINSHARNQPWWANATEIKLQRFDTADELAAAEVEAIRTESPRWNSIHTDRPPVWAYKPRGRIGDGSVFQRADGQWVGSFDLPPVDGKRKQARVYGRTREEAAEKLAARRARGH